MPLMQWDETMSVGDPKLDSQHQTLIDLINNAFEAIQRHDEHLLSELIDQMREYAVMHFHFEEDQMERNGYPDLDRHRELHDSFNDQVDKFQQDLFSKTNLSQIFVFLSRWLTTHIMSEDKQYMPFMPKEEAGEQGE